MKVEPTASEEFDDPEEVEALIPWNDACAIIHELPVILEIYSYASSSGTKCQVKLHLDKNTSAKDAPPEVVKIIESKFRKSNSEIKRLKKLFQCIGRARFP